MTHRLPCTAKQVTFFIFTHIKFD